MRTEFPAEFLATEDGRRADAILRSCVHCGFCNATCPTYQLTGDELDGPRGRIYLAKAVLEQPEPVRDETTNRAQQHLDRCLTCRACETTCPSGVAYGELAEIARDHLAPVVQRSAQERLMRWWLLTQLARPGRFRWWARLGRLFRWALPKALREAVPASPRRLRTRKRKRKDPAPAIPPQTFRDQRFLLLGGCVQQAATPATAAAAQRYLERRGANFVRAAGEPCCAALPLHLGEDARTAAMLRTWLDWIEPRLDAVDYLVSSASGCGVTLKDYERLAQRYLGAGSPLSAEQQQRYQRLATAAAAKVIDPTELITAASEPQRAQSFERLAWHAPCTLQHGQQLGSAAPDALVAAGYELTPVPDAHLCCGSAGTYAVLQPAMASELRANKLAVLESGGPEVLATANVGCQLHLEAAAGLPVRHWLELIE